MSHDLGVLTIFRLSYFIPLYCYPFVFYRVVFLSYCILYCSVSFFKNLTGVLLSKANMQLFIS